MTVAPARRVVLVLLLLAAASCADTRSPAASSPVQRLHADYAFPVDTLEDWVTYGDAFVTFTIVKIEAIPLSDDDEGRSEGVLSSSQLTAQIEDSLWTRPGAEPMPPSVAFTWLTSVRSGGQDRPAVDNNGQMLEVGRRYVGLFARVDSEHWQPVTGETMARIEADDRVAVPDHAPPTTAQALIDGRAVSEVGELLSSTPQHAGFAADEDLTPLERYCRVAEAGGPKGVLGLDACGAAA